MRNRVPRLVFLLCLVAASSSQAAGIRDRTRPTDVQRTTVTQSQASELTLTLTQTAMRSIQTWIRTAGTLDEAGRVVTTFVRFPAVELVQLGQRVRSFPVTARTQIHQGRITEVTMQADGALVRATLANQVHEDGARHLMEIIVERGPFLTIPNVSIIEEGDEQIVYVQTEEGNYFPQRIEKGLQGELYTEVLQGLEHGDRVVSIGSFFVDAEHKLNSSRMIAMPGMDHGGMDMPGTDQEGAPMMPETGQGQGAMPGMDHGQMDGVGTEARR